MRLMRPVSPQSGDTIIEVMFAFAIFAMIAVGALSIMNQGTATAQRSLEITLVRAQMDAQAEALRYIHQAYVAAFEQGVTPDPATPAYQWKLMKDKALGATQPSAFGQAATSCPTSAPGHNPFILNARTAKIAGGAPQMSAPAGGSLPPFAQVMYNADSSIKQAYGLWIEAVPSNVAQGTSFVDFHIRSCWGGVGGVAPVTLGTIVRLYEPR